MQKITFCRGLSSTFFQRTVQLHVEEQENRLRNNPLKPVSQQKGNSINKNLFFIDDISMAAADKICHCSQPTLEVLRQMISEGWYFSCGTNLNSSVTGT